MNDGLKNRLIHRWKSFGREYRLVGPGERVRGGSYMMEEMSQDALGGEKWSQVSTVEYEDTTTPSAWRVLMDAIEQLSKATK